MIGDDSLLRLKLLTTGGTIEKVYDESAGALLHARSPFELILGRMRLPTVEISHESIMSKDSLEMTEHDRAVITEKVRSIPARFDAILVVHGTDTLQLTGEYLYAALTELQRPIVLTGSMRPFEFRDTDAHQNIYESILACRLLQAGIYCVMHSKVLRFPGVIKDRTRLTFVRSGSVPLYSAVSPSSDGRGASGDGTADHAPDHHH